MARSVVRSWTVSRRGLLPLVVPRALLCAWVALLVLRLALGVVRVPAGFEASYWTGAARGAAERSTEFLSLASSGVTRIDQRLEFQGDQFPVHFFNDASRFNFGPDVQPARDQLPFLVRWRGVLEVPSSGSRTFRLEAAGPARLAIDSREVLSQAGEASVDLTQGPHQLELEYTRPEARVPKLRLSWQRDPAADAAGVTVVDAGAGVPSRALDAAVLFLGVSCAAAWVLGRRTWLLLLPLGFAIYGALQLAPLAGRATILSGLDDWLVYESQARDILLNGLLMNGGQEHAPAYYGQPLYPYVLALAHLLTGEGLFGPLVLQFAALGGLLALAYVLARRAFDSHLAGLAALAGLWLFIAVQNEYLRVARQLFNENLYMPLVLASLIALVSLARQQAPPTLPRLLGLGLLLGVTAIARSQFLAFVPLALLVLLLAWRRSRPLLDLVAPLLVIVAGTVLAIAPVTARNWVVSGQLVPISASGGASLLEFHRPPSGLIDQTALQSDPLYNFLHLDASARTVVAFARADPLGYLKTWLPLGAHSVGLPGRNPAAGVYWPLLIVVALYVASFALPQTRKRHVWIIHAFVLSHLLVLMLFEADTYGYRLVMPMYAPMMVVAAQLLTALLQRVDVRSKQLRLVPAAVAPAAVAVVAVALQGKALAEAWPDRATSLLGLGGAAAHAGTTAERTGAEAIFYASVDGTPRRFGAGALPGLRYPWIKWFDPTVSLPLPAAGTSAVYALAELRGDVSSTRGVTPASEASEATPASGMSGLTACLGTPDGGFERTASGDEVRARCLVGLQPTSATFEGVARVQATQLPGSVEAGQSTEAKVLWEPLTRPREPYQLWLHLQDGDAQAGNATVEPYAKEQWQPGEAVLTRLELRTDQTALPDTYPLALGWSTSGGKELGRVAAGTVALAPSRVTDIAMLPLPPDMQRVNGVAGGGLELLAVRPPAHEAAAGSRLKLGLLWHVLQDAPSAEQLRVQVRAQGGQVMQDLKLPVLGGKLASLRKGSVVRDEAAFDLSGADGTVAVSIGMGAADSTAEVGTISVKGREHVLDTSGKAPKAVFGKSMALLDATLEPSQAAPGTRVTVHLTWRAQGTMERAYKVFVHVLDQQQANVLAQRDAEPIDGKAPTPGWVANELIEDELQLQLPGSVPTGTYPLEIGVYEERSGERLLLPGGESRFLLDTRLQVK